MSRFRSLKEELIQLLQDEDWEDNLTALDQHAPGALVGPLMSFFHRESPLRWRAITAFGLTVHRMAQERMEDARVVMRRLMWNLNEESGGLGWGSAEAMGEVLALNEKLAQEFGSILISYIHDSCKADNFIDHAPLRLGAYWGISRFVQARPELADNAGDRLLCGLNEQEVPAIRGIAAWGLGILAYAEAADMLRERTADDTAIELYRNRVVEHTTVGALAAEALERIS